MEEESQHPLSLCGTPTSSPALPLPPLRVSLGSALGGEGDVAISPGTTYVVRLELRPPASFASQPVHRLVLHAPPVPNPSQDVARGVLELKLEVLKDGLALPLVDTLSFHKKKNERRSYLEHDLKTTPLAIHLSEVREDRPEGRSYSSAIYVRFNVRGKQSERWLLRASVPILGPRVQVDVPLTFHGGKRKAVAPSPSPSPSPTSSQQLCTPSPSPSPYSSSSSSSISASPSSSLPSPSPQPQPTPLQPCSSPAAAAPPSHVFQRLLHLMTPGSAQRAVAPAAAAQIEPSPSAAVRATEQRLPPAAVSSPPKPTTTAATATATSPAALPPHTQLMSTRSEVKKVIPDGARLRSLDEKIVVHITGKELLEHGGHLDVRLQCDFFDVTLPATAESRMANKRQEVRFTPRQLFGGTVMHLVPTDRVKCRLSFYCAGVHIAPWQRFTFTIDAPFEPTEPASDSVATGRAAARVVQEAQIDTREADEPAAKRPRTTAYDEPTQPPPPPLQQHTAQERLPGGEVVTEPCEEEDTEEEFGGGGNWLKTALVDDEPQPPAAQGSHPEEFVDMDETQEEVLDDLEPAAPVPTEPMVDQPRHTPVTAATAPPPPVTTPTVAVTATATATATTTTTSGATSSAPPRPAPSTTGSTPPRPPAASYQSSPLPPRPPGSSSFILSSIPAHLFPPRLAAANSLSRPPAPASTPTPAPAVAPAPASASAPASTSVRPVGTAPRPLLPRPASKQAIPASMWRPLAPPAWCARCSRIHQLPCYTGVRTTRINCHGQPVPSSACWYCGIEGHRKTECELRVWHEQNAANKRATDSIASTSSTANP